ncbi:hypothetical protein AMELA_G00237640 [Ameiurus melas]|uniref:Uncharacterized protein n=1 Tax=Ameiurus melas TaxID=219545 RepID=A0A7J5ZYJ3_AMEME|nr:hypothetical protein AMELA_G00237640 [Ameiurus melas]
MSLDWGKKPEYLDETLAARGEHADSTHTGQSDRKLYWRPLVVTAELVFALVTKSPRDYLIPPRRTRTGVVRRPRWRRRVRSRLYKSSQAYAESTCFAQALHVDPTQL